MAEKIPDDIEAKKFFEEIVPQQFEAMDKIEGMDGTQLAVQFNITGEGGGNWTLVVTDGKNMEVKPQEDEKAQITITMDVKDWRDTVTGKIQGLDIMQQTGRGSRAQFDKLKTVSGTLRLELTKEDGNLLPMELMFNKAATPQTTLKAKATDYADIQSGKLNGQQAFMSGKIKISGDMGFAMKIGTMMM
ncbi:MAG: SCP2 sterol-binding domain-containing protein [Deltaproteobacteria bacterium]|nr:MAG: SCP2 sterol-binding domain-containing protein [Deltaproteobacteria bacterium]